MERSLTRITVAAATRQRPRMLADLLQSLQGLDVPQGAELSFVFVENDVILSISGLVDDFHKRTGWPARAVHEPRQGISYARNAIIDAATEDGADWLAFMWMMMNTYATIGCGFSGPVQKTPMRSLQAGQLCPLRPRWAVLMMKPTCSPITCARPKSAICA